MLESGENYLHTILRLQEEKGAVRSVDVALALAVSRPSVSRATANLRRSGYLDADTHGRLVLTEKGITKARMMLERNEAIAAFFAQCLGVNQWTAQRDACRFEHHISDETYTKLKAWLAQHAPKPE